MKIRESMSENPTCRLVLAKGWMRRQLQSRDSSATGENIRIVAQADLALKEKAEKVHKTVAEISISKPSPIVMA